MAKVPANYNPWKLIARDVHRVQRMILSERERDDDIRLSEAEMHRGMLEILDGEPLFYLAGLVKKYIDPRSKLTADPDVIRRILTDLHDRTYPVPDRARRKTVNDNQFELEFMWSTDGADRVAVAQFEKVEDHSNDG